LQLLPKLVPGTPAGLLLFDDFLLMLAVFFRFKTLCGWFPAKEDAKTV
jgi:hypothetical protein